MISVLSGLQEFINIRIFLLTGINIRINIRIVVDTEGNGGVMAKGKVFEFVQNEYRDFNASQYQQMVCTSYTGGASWLRSKADNGFFVVACTPVEILSYFRNNPESTVRGQFVPFRNTELG